VALAVGLVGAAALAAVFVTGGPAWAYVSPGCHASATDATGKAVPASITIDGTSVWNVSKVVSRLSGKGAADTDQTFGNAKAAAFGFGWIPIASGTGKGRSGSGSLDVSAFADKVRVIGVVGGSDSCSGYLTVVVQDESALDTLAGKVSAGVAVLGALGVLAVAVRSR